MAKITTAELQRQRNAAVKSVRNDRILKVTGAELADIQARAVPPIMMIQGKKTGWNISIGSYKNGLIR